MTDETVDYDVETAEENLNAQSIVAADGIFSGVTANQYVDTTRDGYEAPLEQSVLETYGESVQESGKLVKTSEEGYSQIVDDNIAERVGRTFADEMERIDEFDTPTYIEIGHAVMAGYAEGRELGAAGATADQARETAAFTAETIKEIDSARNTATKAILNLLGDDPETFQNIPQLEETHINSFGDLMVRAADRGHRVSTK